MEFLKDRNRPKEMSDTQVMKYFINIIIIEHFESYDETHSVLRIFV